MHPYHSELTQGLDLNALSYTPAVVPARNLEIDADFLAYMVAGSDDCSFPEMQTRTRKLIDKLVHSAGASSYTLHLTPKESTKGNRKQIALLSEYQGNRKGKEKPQLLHAVRSWMSLRLGAVRHLECEADDGIAMKLYRDPENSVICTKDKDLKMIPGKWLDWDTGELSETTDPFGWIELKHNKLDGRGWKFFFAQMLMGDPVDNIKGLPKYVSPMGKLKNIGPKTTYDVLNGITDVADCYKQILRMYNQLYNAAPELFVNYRDGSPVSMPDVLMSNMKLLWMRRNLDENDVLYWLQENLHAIH